MTTLPTTAELKAGLYNLTFKNADAMARALNGGQPIGFNPLVRFGKAQTGGRPMVHAFADYILVTFDAGKISELLPAYSDRSRAARQYVTAKKNVPLPPAERPASLPDTVTPLDEEGYPAEDTAQETQPERTLPEYTAGSLEASIAAICRSEIEAHGLTAQTNVDPATVARIAKGIIDAAIAEAMLPRQTHVTVTRQDGTTAAMGLQHKSFPDLMRLASLRDAKGFVYPVWLPGPAGSGKTTAAENVAKGLGLAFHHTGAVDTEYKLLGFATANGTTVRTSFREAYEHGGVFLFDEVDASAPGAMVALNAALENGSCAFPDGNIPRHADCIVIAAANTYGGGATHEYVGRNKLDAATVDRFIMLAWDYDTELERAIAQNDAWVTTVQGIRAAVHSLGIKHVVSPRASYRGAAMLAAGFSRADVLRMVVQKGLTPDQWSNVTSRAGVR